MIKKIFDNYSNYLPYFALLIFSLIINFFPSNLTEPDNIIHISYAELYKNFGIFFSDFRWDNFSVFATYKSDMWYGFHLLLVPFLFVKNYLTSISLAGAFLTFTYSASIYFVLKNTNAKWPIFWSVFAVLITPNQYVRYTDLRPHVLISAIAVVFTYFTLWREKKWVIFLLSTIIGFLEISLFWLLPLLTGIFFVGQTIISFLSNNSEYIKSISIRFLNIFALVFLGVVLGAFLRPNPVDGLYLVYYQIIYLYSLKFFGGVLPMVSELQPMALIHLQYSIPIIFVFCVAVFFWYLEIKPREDVKKSVYVDSLIFSAMTFFLLSIFSFRAFDFFIVFAFLLSPIILENKSSFIYISIKEKFIYKFCLGAFVVSVSMASIMGGINFRLTNGLGIDKYKDASLFLEKSTEKGDGVFLLTHGEYPSVFIWNKNNSYPNHSDEVFRRAYNPLVYDKFLCSLNKLSVIQEIWADMTEKKLKQTCSEFTDLDLVDLLKKEMNSRYVLLDRKSPINLIKYFLGDNRVSLFYTDTNSMVFRLR